MNVMKTFTAGALALALSMSVAKAADIVDTAIALAHSRRSSPRSRQLALSIP